MKDVSRLTITDLEKHPLWRFTGSDDPAETCVAPVVSLPVTSITGMLVGSPVQLASGKKVMALLGNLDSESIRHTQHFLTISIFRDDGALFHMARYHDFDANERGPDAMAAFLNMQKEEIFPILWDVRHLVTGGTTFLHGMIYETPTERLSRSEIIALAVK